MPRPDLRKILLVAIATIGFCGAAEASIVVPGTADIWAWNGTPPPDDIVTPPANVSIAPVLAIADLSGIGSITFGVSGETGNCPGCDGIGPLQGHLDGAVNDLPDLLAPLNSLVGAWIDLSNPDQNVAFEIGSGGTFAVPDGAVELFLGSMDGFQWNNNEGAFLVDLTENPSVSLFSFAQTDVPEPLSVMLFGSGLAGVLALRRRKSSNKASSTGE